MGIWVSRSSMLEVSYPTNAVGAMLSVTVGYRHREAPAPAAGSAAACDRAACGVNRAGDSISATTAIVVWAFGAAGAQERGGGVLDSRRPLSSAGELPSFHDQAVAFDWVRVRVRVVRFVPYAVSVKPCVEYLVNYHGIWSGVLCALGEPSRFRSKM